jgi:maltooligosyltrehalose trehalohydrolase
MTVDDVGAMDLGQGQCRFRVWAPFAQRVDLHLVSAWERLISLEKEKDGYFSAVIDGVETPCHYFYRLDDRIDRPDPASRFQPEGVHGPSEVVSSDFFWADDCWFGLPLRDYIIYELHVGTYTPQGTFDAVISHLDAMLELGITAVELMPVAQFPGYRNWGYDGTYPFAVQNSYGGPFGLKQLINACHQRGLAVILDVVYNHLGPEGNYLSDFGPYFTDAYRTPWGSAVNFDGPHSDHVRRFFVQNALFWVTEFHIDALRIDAVHAILDFSAQPFLEELALAVHERAEQLNRRIYLIAESALNDTRIVRAREFGGFNLDAQWNDDFHHCLHTLLTGERSGYYCDYGQLRDLAKAYREGFVYSGEYSVYRQRRHGNSSRNLPAHCFVVSAQNHDQVGNRRLGERLSKLVSFECLKLAAGVVILSPFIPLILMGEEYGETAPFLYFVSHSDPELVESVREGRRREFAAFGYTEAPDPQEEATFLKARINHQLSLQGHHRILRDFYKELIRLRKEIRPLGCLSKKTMDVLGYERKKILVLRRWNGGDEAVAVFHFGNLPVSAVVPIPVGSWEKLIDSADKRWEGPGRSVHDNLLSDGEVFLTLPPHSMALFISREEIKKET